jgi:hypothetical protein
MKKTARTLLLLVSLFILSESCKKESTTTPSVITLSVAAPNENQDFSNGDKLSIKGAVSDGNGLHTLTIEVIDDKTGKLILEKKPTVLDMKSYNFEETWNVQVSEWTNATLKVTAKNHSNETMTKSLKINLWL